MAGSHDFQDASIGLILGTGCNGSYIEEASKILRSIDNFLLGEVFIPIITDGREVKVGSVLPSWILNGVHLVIMVALISSKLNGIDSSTKHPFSQVIYSIIGFIIYSVSTYSYKGKAYGLSRHLFSIILIAHIKL